MGIRTFRRVLLLAALAGAPVPAPAALSPAPRVLPAQGTVALFPSAAAANRPAGVLPLARPPGPPAVKAPAAEAPLPGAGRRLWRGAPVPPGPTPEARARAVLAREARRIGLHRAPGELVLVRAFDSPLGTHVRFRQEVAGVPVHGSEASVHWAPDGRLLVVNADLFPVPGGSPAPRLDAAAAGAAAGGLASGDGEGPAERGEPRLAWLPTGRSALLAWEIVVRSEDETLRVFVDAVEGGILLAEDLRRSAEGTARVFDPNPVWSRRDAALLDGDDADQPALEAELVEVPLPRLDGSGFLRGKWADLTPTKSRAFEPDLAFRYTRSDPRFEQANVYFHLDRLQEHVHAVLGLEGAAGEPLRADAHHGRYDNSYFDTGTGRLYFGDGGVDDAEDADIIAHEYGHALQDALVPGFGRSLEAGSMGEGFGDWVAASRRTSGDETWDAAVGSWDATAFAAGNPPALRRVDGRKEYPRDLEGEVHADGEIWSSALREIERRIGTADADRVVFASHLLLTPRASFADGAAAILAADLVLRGGAGEEDLRAAFEGRGIPPGDDPLEGDDGPAAALPVDRSRYDGMYAADDDWFRIEAGPGPGVTCVAEPWEGGGRASLALFDGSLRLLSESGRFAAVPFAGSGPLAARTALYLRVSPGREGRCPYDLRIDGTTFPPPADRFEPNGAPATAARLPTGAAQRLLLAPGDEDWFLLEGTEGATVELSAAFDGGAVDADLALFTTDLVPVAEAATTDAPEVLTRVLLPGDPPALLLRVAAASGSGPVDLLAFLRPAGDLAPGRALEGVLAPGAETVFALPVPPEPGVSARVSLSALRLGRRGALPEVEVHSPGGFVVAPFGSGLGERGSRLQFAAPEGGEWRVRLRDAEGVGGRFRIRARVR